MSGHTPGPWRVYEGGNFIKVVPSDYPESPSYLGGAVCDIDDMIGPPGQWVSGVSRHQRWLDDESGKVPVMRANARLIAAAPELLEACKFGLDLLEHYGECEQVDAMRAAIAKAEGRS